MNMKRLGTYVGKPAREFHERIVGKAREKSCKADIKDNSRDFAVYYCSVSSIFSRFSARADARSATYLP